MPGLLEYDLFVTSPQREVEIEGKHLETFIAIDSNFKSTEYNNKTLGFVFYTVISLF